MLFLFSKYSSPCDVLIKKIYTNNIDDNFKFICIDNEYIRSIIIKSTKIQINSIPCILHLEDNELSKYEGVKCFDFIESIISQYNDNHTNTNHTIDTIDTNNIDNIDNIENYQQSQSNNQTTLLENMETDNQDIPIYAGGNMQRFPFIDVGQDPNMDNDIYDDMEMTEINNRPIGIPLSDRKSKTLIDDASRMAAEREDYDKSSQELHKKHIFDHTKKTRKLIEKES